MSTEKKRPDTRIVLKPTEGGPTITLASFYTDRERPSGGLDRRIGKVVLHMLADEYTGAAAYTLEVDNAHGSKSHWCNLYTDAHGTGPAKPAPKGDWSKEYPASAAGEQQDLGEEDYPF